MRVHARRLLVPALVLIAVLAGVAPVGAVSSPSVRLIAPVDQVTVQERSRGGYGLDLGLWLAAVNGDFEIHVARPDYRSDPVATQTTRSGSLVRSIPIEDLDGWFGFARFLHTSIKDEKGRAVYRNVQTFCPNGWDTDRVDDSGPATPSYPQWCGANPFTKSVVWGIDRGWATNPLQWTYLPARTLEAGTYSVRVWIDPAFVDLFEIPLEDAEARISLVVQPKSSSSAGPETRSEVDARPLASVPEIVPTGDTVPNMAALPAWGIGVYRRKGRDYLSFGATVWNGGPAPLTVEGFRQPGQDVMDAWQYFTDASGDVVGKAQVGQMAYDPRPGHEHWHFEQFTDYALMDATKTQAIMSEKQSFCLGPTDPIDLLADRADWSGPWGSECGSPGSLWVRESLPTGWGDTYFQWLPGQSFDVTDVPSGTYFIRVQVNPLGELYDRTSADDVSFRRVRLRGRIGGHRWVVVPAYQGIDSESCWGCFAAPGQPRWDGLPTWPPA